VLGLSRASQGNSQISLIPYSSLKQHKEEEGFEVF
jgi:hypothetical protein